MSIDLTALLVAAASAAARGAAWLWSKVAKKREEDREWREPNAYL